MFWVLISVAIFSAAWGFSGGIMYANDEKKLKEFSWIDQILDQIEVLKPKEIRRAEIEGGGLLVCFQLAHSEELKLYLKQNSSHAEMCICKTDAGGDAYLKLTAPQKTRIRNLILMKVSERIEEQMDNLIEESQRDIPLLMSRE